MTLTWPETGETIVEVIRYYRVPYGTAVLAINNEGRRILAPASDLVVVPE